MARALRLRWHTDYFVPDGTYCEAIIGGRVVPHRETIWALMRAGF